MAEYQKRIAAVSFYTCPECQEKKIMETPRSARVCQQCSRSTKFCAVNNMDPGEVPPELMGLTMIEQMLIAQVSPSLTVMRLPRGGQYGSKDM